MWEDLSTVGSSHFLGWDVELYKVGERKRNISNICSLLPSCRCYDGVPGTNNLMEERFLWLMVLGGPVSGHVAPCTLAEHHGSSEDVAEDVLHLILDRKLRRKDW